MAVVCLMCFAAAVVASTDKKNPKIYFTLCSQLFNGKQKNQNGDDNPKRNEQRM